MKKLLTIAFLTTLSMGYGFNNSAKVVQSVQKYKQNKEVYSQLDSLIKKSSSLKNISLVKANLES